MGFSKGNLQAALVVALAALALVVPLGQANAQGIPPSRGEVYAAADLQPEGDPHDSSMSTATFLLTAEGTTVVSVSGIGLTPGSRHASSIRDGSCSGEVLYPLATLEVNVRGGTHATTELAAEVEFGRWYVVINETEAHDSPVMLCGMVHPAIAGGATVPLPGEAEPIVGMPRTGEDSAPNLPALLTVVAVLLGAGFYVRSRHTRRA